MKLVELLIMGIIEKYQKQKITNKIRLLDLGTLNVANSQYLTAKTALKNARKQKTVKNYEIAEEEYEKFFGYLTIDTNSYVEMAEIKRNLGKYSHAIDNIRMAIELKNQRPRILIRDQSSLYGKLFTLYILNREFDSAESLLDHIKSDKEIYNLRNTLEICLKNFGDSDKNTLNTIYQKINKSFTDKIPTSTSPPTLSMLRPFENSKYKIWIMAFLHYFDIATVADIRSVIKINDATTKRLIDELVEDKILIKINGYRRIHVRLTNDGSEEAKTIVDEIEDILKHVTPKDDDEYKAAKAIDESKNNIKNTDVEQFEISRYSIEVIKKYQEIKEEYKKNSSLL